MGEGVPGGLQTARVLTAEAARAALADAGAGGDLDVTLARSAEILLQRFPADVAMVHVARAGRGIFWAPEASPYSPETTHRDSEAVDDPVFGEPLPSERSGLVDDLAASARRHPGQEAAYARGMRSTMWTQLADERRRTLGFVVVGSARTRAFETSHLSDLEAFGEQLAWFARPAVLLEEQRAERRLLEEELGLFAEMAEAETERDLVDRVSDRVRVALGADLALLIVARGNGRRPWSLSSPSGALSPEQWAAAGAALSAGGYEAFLRRSKETGAFTIADLSKGAETAFGAWTHEALGMNSLAIAVRLQSWGGVGFGIIALRKRRGSWTEAQRTFLARLARVLEISVERIRRGEIAAGHALRGEERSAKVEALTRLLGILDPQLPPAEVARLFAAQVREYLNADAVMLHEFDLETGQRIRVAFDAPAGTTISPERISLRDSAGYLGTLEMPQAIYNASNAGEAPEWLSQASEAMGYHSSVCVRLDAAGEPVGMIAAGSIDAEAMGQAELEILSAVAAPLGMVLERARAVTRLQLQTQRTQAVLDILGALGPADTLEQVAGPVANALRVMYGAEHCAIGEIRGRSVAAVAVDSELMTFTAGAEAPLADLWGEHAPTRAVVHVVADHATEGELADPANQAVLGVRSSMRVLIGSPEDPLGVVTVGSKQPGRYTEHDARQLAEIVQPMALAARYFRGRRETELRTERLETTNRILTRLSAGGTAEHLARGFLAECRSLFDCRHALAVQFDHDAGTGRMLAIDTDFPKAEELPDEFMLEDMHSARLVRQPTPHLVIDARAEPALNVRHLHLIEAGVYSAIRAPLVVHDTVRGAVSLWGEGAGKFSAEDAELLGTLTRPLALALEKASALESLGESELKYRSLVAQADEMIFLFDPVTLRVLDANSFTSRALGYSPDELIRLTLDKLMDAPMEEIAQTVAAAVADGELHLSDAKFLRADGEALDIEAVASMVTFGGRQAVLVLARDISERRALLRQLMQSQKMDSLGAMAGAVAHDFNNLLTTILGFAGLLKRSRNMDTEERENLALIEDAARRAADLTGRLLSFSRGGLVRFGRVDLRTVIEDTLQLAEPTMHASLHVTCAIPECPVLVEGDAGQLQQAFTNIVLNARDAMPEGGGIELSLAIDGPVAVVRIDDTGPGMDEETRVRIFEPFYTTKPLGSGTGLGMAITYGIIQGHHGDIAVQSQPGQGTQFTISLPLLDAETNDIPADSFNAGEGNLVLVVDDDAMVRRTTTATLAELGYNVVEAPGGSTAVEILRARPDRFSAVLLDLVMPGMTGSETFRALTAIRPDLPVVVCTGYAADSHIDTDVKRRIAGLVQKPFTAERLGRALAAAGAVPTRASRI